MKNSLERFKADFNRQKNEQTWTLNQQVHCVPKEGMKQWIFKEITNFPNLMKDMNINTQAKQTQSKMNWKNFLRHTETGHYIWISFNTARKYTNYKHLHQNSKLCEARTESSNRHFYNNSWKLIRHSHQWVEQPTEDN